ncbi:MAG: DUF3048 domain-containing protein [Coriobacteriales bacterium]|nr:DUF3048 domain-containing protein [Coriobacteriales bacterium]
MSSILLTAVLLLALVSCKKASEPAAPVSENIDVQDQGQATEEVSDSVWPLTGLPIAEGDSITRRPLSIKIENTPAARPQTGISHADVVYESVTEGGITRFNCIFQSDIPDEVGPVRSARDSDISIVPQYQALFFYSGANSTVNKEIKKAGIDNMGNTPAASLYHRVDYRVAPHNLYLNLAEVYNVATGLGFATQLQSPSALQFGPSKLADAKAATNLTVPLSDGYVAKWTWDQGSGSYIRSMDGASLDAETNQALSANNVVILWASYELGVVANNSQTYNINLTTSGKASVFMGGQQIDGTWEASKTKPPRFKDAQGNEVKLTPGKTWFEVVNTDVEVSSS